MRLVVIGGGPVGLFTAWMAKQKLPATWTITVVEKRYQPARQQILLLDAHTINLMSERLRNSMFGTTKPGCWVLAPTKDNLAVCYRKNLPLASIVTNVLEKQLGVEAQNAGISIVRPPAAGSFDVAIDETNATVTANGNVIGYDVLVGADGAGSYVRNNILRAQTTSLWSDRKLYGVIITSKTTPDKLGGIEEEASAERQRQVESARPQQQTRFFRSQTGNYYMGFVINADQYTQIDEAQKAGRDMPDFLRQKMTTLCSQVKAQCNLDIKDLMYSAFPITPSVTERFSKLEPRPVYLVGDAAITTHFFTGSGVNVGIRTGETLVNLLQKYPDGKIPVDVYAAAMQPHANYIADRVNEVIEGERPRLPIGLPFYRRPSRPPSGRKRRKRKVVWRTGPRGGRYRLSRGRKIYSRRR